MASTCNRFINRTTSLKSVIKPKLRIPSLNGSATTSFPRFPLSTKSTSSVRRFSSFIKSPASELGCAQSLMPLHSAVAVARMTSCLSSSLRSCRALSQELGLSVPR